MQLAEGRNVIDAGVGAGVGEHDETVTHQDATAIRHDGAALPSGGPGPIYRCGRPSGNLSSILDLLRRLVDTDLNRNDLAGPAGAGPAQGAALKASSPTATLTWASVAQSPLAAS